MGDAERIERHVIPPGPEIQAPRRDTWGQALYTLCYLLFEIICFAALLSISIGIRVLISFLFEFFLNVKISIFIQTYITLYLVMNFAYAQARHQVLHILPMRGRFGMHAHCCFYCTYPCSVWFGLLVVAYVNLLYQFSRLFCLHPVLGHKEADKVSIDGNKVEDTKLSSWSGEMGTTTALFLLSLCTIQYLTCRKLQWDYHIEVKNVQIPAVLPRCASYLYSGVVLLFVQVILTVLYVMPLLLWLLLSRLFLWSVSTTVITAITLSILVGFCGSFIERQEPFPTLNNNRLYHVVNLKLRANIMCLIIIPLVGYWFFKAEKEHCVLTIPRKHSSNIDLYNFFLLNVCVCIINTVKFTSLHSHSVRARELEIRVNQRGEENRIGPEGPGAPFGNRNQNDQNGPQRVVSLPNADTALPVNNNNNDQGSKPDKKDEDTNEVTMDQEGNEVRKKPSSNGMILKKEQINNNVQVQPSSSKRPTDSNSNELQLLKALQTLQQTNEKSPKIVNDVPQKLESMYESQKNIRVNDPSIEEYLSELSKTSSKSKIHTEKEIPTCKLTLAPSPRASNNIGNESSNNEKSPDHENCMGKDSIIQETISSSSSGARQGNNSSVELAK